MSERRSISWWADPSAVVVRIATAGWVVPPRPEWSSPLMAVAAVLMALAAHDPMTALFELGAEPCPVVEGPVLAPPVVEVTAREVVVFEAARTEAGWVHERVGVLPLPLDGDVVSVVRSWPWSQTPPPGFA